MNQHMLIVMFCFVIFLLLVRIVRSVRIPIVPLSKGRRDRIGCTVHNYSILWSLN